MAGEQPRPVRREREVRQEWAGVSDRLWVLIVLGHSFQSAQNVARFRVEDRDQDRRVAVTAAANDPATLRIKREQELSDLRRVPDFLAGRHFPRGDPGLARPA